MKKIYVYDLQFSFLYKKPIRKKMSTSAYETIRLLELPPPFPPSLFVNFFYKIRNCSWFERDRY